MLIERKEEPYYQIKLSIEEAEFLQNFIASAVEKLPSLAAEIDLMDKPLQFLDELLDNLPDGIG